MSYLCIMEKDIKERHCTGCNTTKIITEFVKDKYDKSGFTYRCKKCRNKASYEWNQNNKDKVKAANLKNRDKRKQFYNSPEGIISSRKAHLKRIYNLTLDAFDKMLEDQNFKCAVCEGNETHDKHRVMAVDHCHETGKIRGLLCFKCNSALGNFNDNKQLLINAIKYLEKHESTTIR